MSDKHEKKESDEEEDQELTDEQRWKRAYLRRIADRVTKKSEKGRKVDKGFEGAYASGENVRKYLRFHNFKYAAEPKLKVPESKPTAVSGEPWKEPSKWIPPKPTENLPRKDTTETLQIPEKPITDHGRREAEGADGKNQNDIRKADALRHDDLAILGEKAQSDNPTELVTTLDIETPAKSAHDITSEIISGMEKAGFEHIATETDQADYTFEPSFLEDDLEKMDATVREDSISPLELSETHEQIRQHEIENILEEQQQELLQDFEIQPQFHDEFHDDIGMTDADTITEPPSSLENPTKPRHEIADAEME